MIREVSSGVLGAEDWNRQVERLRGAPAHELARASAAVLSLSAAGAPASALQLPLCELLVCASLLGAPDGGRDARSGDAGDAGWKSAALAVVAASAARDIWWVPSAAAQTESSARDDQAAYLALWRWYGAAGRALGAALMLRWGVSPEQVFSRALVVRGLSDPRPLHALMHARPSWKDACLAPIWEAMLSSQLARGERGGERLWLELCTGVMRDPDSGLTQRALQECEAVTQRLLRRENLRRAAADGLSEPWHVPSSGNWLGERHESERDPELRAARAQRRVVLARELGLNAEPRASGPRSDDGRPSLITPFGELREPPLQVSAGRRRRR